uniref:Reverse transcriptase domain-containing protein n=1 Tax=Tanacetum cinerariifolium TaxID=118510 RepID=A0A6L2KRT6_TANCI|nr:reverse transcriptase domain-containing protein [Tanacetum cinerariifolium]
MMANQIDVIDMACEEYSQEVLGFSYVIASGNPTPYFDSTVSTTSPTLTPFKNSDFHLKEVDAFLALEDDPTSPKVDQSYELKICKAKTDKSLIDEPPKVELKDLPPHLEFTFLEGDDKFPVIITKDLSAEEKTALITVMKSHKRAIAWKLFDIKGIDPEFCIHKILMDEDFEPALSRITPKQVVRWRYQTYELNKLRDQAYENSLIYKEKTKRLHDTKIKDRIFNIDDRVLISNSRLNIFSSKLKSHWSGPFTISHIFPYNTVELSQPDEPNFKVNSHRLKHYFGEDIPKMVVPDLQTFPKDQ